MTKAELIDHVHSQINGRSKKETAAIVQEVFNGLQEAVKSGGRFSYPGFGTFKVKERAARQGRNPKTGATIKIKASKTVGFKPSGTFKDSL
ncbi:MAG: HU family DNA-binding protein [Deltaproteobacteria bacterium]|nr:HU family DNA-binding protein [Deltaproteobacteria bacterium]MCB9785160.1 HU family DNA-binding protein [Deltaproteobacteria bacterium]